MDGEELYEARKKFFCVRTGSRGGKAWAAALTTVPVKGELRDTENLAADVPERQIEFSPLICKYPKVGDLPRPKSDFLFVVLSTNSYQK